MLFNASSFNAWPIDILLWLLTSQMLLEADPPIASILLFNILQFLINQFILLFFWIIKLVNCLLNHKTFQIMYTLFHNVPKIVLGCVQNIL